MEPTEQPSTPKPKPSSDEVDVERSLLEAEEMLKEIKMRYEQIQAAKAKQPTLEARLAELQAEHTHHKGNSAANSQTPETAARLAELKAELENIKGQLATTWETLESQLITWRDKEELFWQFLRFAGVGFALALLLNSLLK